MRKLDDGHTQQEQVAFFNRSFVYPFNYVELTSPAFNLAREKRAVKVEVTEETTGLNFQLKVYAIIRFDRSIGERRRDSLVKSSNNVSGWYPVILQTQYFFSFVLTNNFKSTLRSQRSTDANYANCLCASHERACEGQTINRFLGNR